MGYDNEEQERRRGRSRRKADAPAHVTGQNKSKAGHEASEVMTSEKRRSQVEQLKKAKAKKKTRRRIITMIIAECFALLAIFGYAYFARRLNMMPRPEVDKKYVQNEELQVEDLQKMEGYWMIALFGVDSRSGNVGAGSQSDVNMICCINQDTGEIKLVSVYRDTYLQTGEERYSKFNEAYAKGGPEQALKYLNRNLDLNITDYATFSWRAVAEAITILGGVNIDVSQAEYKYINGFITETVEATGLGSHHLKSAGTQLLDGVQSVAYARLRLMDSDYARTERQKEIIKAAFDKAIQADYSVLNNILVTVLPQVSTNLGFADLTNVALNITKYHIGETSGFPSARGEANMGSKGACVIPQTLESNVIALHTFLFGDNGYTPTDTVKAISVKISADTGMYSQGKPAGPVSTEGYLPKETKAPTVEETSAQESEAESVAAPLETDAFGNPIETLEGETISEYPGIGETDEFGNLIDGPETENPDIPLDEPGSYPGSESGPGSQTKPDSPGSQTRPDDSTGPGIMNESNASSGPGGSETSAESGDRPLRPGDEVDRDQVSGPGTQSDGNGESGIPYPGYVPEETTQAAVTPGGSVEETQTAPVIDPRQTTGTTDAVGPGMVN